MSYKSEQDSKLIKWINDHFWLDGCDLETEYLQAQQEGRDLTSVEAEFTRLLNIPRPGKSWNQHYGGGRDVSWLKDAGKLMDKVQKLPTRKDYPYVEPSDLPRIKKARPNHGKGAKVPQWAGSRDQFLEKLHGGLVARIAGCLLGKPVEGSGAGAIRMLAQTQGNWPVTDYFRKPTEDEYATIQAAGFKNRWDDPNLMRGTINGMQIDDDTNYTVAGLKVVKEFGKDFTSESVAHVWVHNLPIMYTATAERIAFRNFINLVLPPKSATYRNPYREWIGAQIRADYFGYANPGNPTRAAEWAWRDASISHIKNGIYGEMWVAAMLAAAYVETDMLTIIRAGLAEIPAKSRLAEDIEKIITLFQSGASYDHALESIYDQWKEDSAHNRVHTLSNAQIVTLALLFGGDSLDKTLGGAVGAGFDTDCNGATAGSIWGIRYGYSAISGKWKDCLNDTLRTSLSGYDQIKISTLAQDMVEVAMKNIE